MTAGRDFTAEEVRQLAAAFPEYVGRAPDGTVYAELTRSEFRNLADRYPTHFTVTPLDQVTPDAAADALAARYPTMRRGA